MKTKDHTSRRDFLKKTSLALGAIMIVPRHVLGKGYLAPSDKMNLAAIGAGGKGTVNINLSYMNGLDNIVTLCDVDDRQSAEMRAKFPKASYYKDYRVMLEKEKNNIDGVLISTPDHMHAVQAMAAMQLGKHVYVEKPLTHDIYEARMLTKAAQQYKVVTQMGNQGSSSEGIRRVQEFYDAGLLGAVNEVHVWTNRPVWPQGLKSLSGQYTIPAELDFDLWLGTAPKRDFHPELLPFKWRGWWEYGTGALGDMACHIMDVPFKVLKLGYPSEVYASVSQVFFENWTAAELRESCPPASTIHLKFPRAGKPDLKMTWYDGGLLPERPEEMGDESLPDNGMIFIGSKNKMLAGQWGANPTLLPKTKMQEAKLPALKLPRVENKENGHQQQWIKACKMGFEKGKDTVSSPFSFAGPLTESILMGNLAIRSYNTKFEGKYTGRKKLLWDGTNMKITNFDEANAFVKRTYREGYSL
ncbi:MAG: Gfo/Idh/MocA family oxidoreductase [Verrucomicrobia bacterium]|nr:Gfo/Idh/MocA family oxidoreductase [Cytophagales bacterium]